MPANFHPCGAVPVSGWSVSIWYCHHHQAYWGMVLRYTDSGHQAGAVSESTPVEWGPFDTWEMVQEWIADVAPVDGLAPPPLPGIADS